MIIKLMGQCIVQEVRVLLKRKCLIQLKKNSWKKKKSLVISLQLLHALKSKTHLIFFTHKI